MENSILSKDTVNKDLFLNILLKSEIVINNFNKNSENEKSITKENNLRTYKRVDKDSKVNMYLIAYCFSNFEHTSLYPQFSQDKAFIEASKKLGVKKNTLKNTRDWFDGHNKNHRNGWWQQPLPEEMKKFKDIYDKKNKESILNEARQILNIRQNNKSNNENFGTNLKNKKYSGKFRSQKEVEEFIQIVLKDSPTIEKDLVKQCSPQSFRVCYSYFSKNYKLPTKKLADQVKNLDARTFGDSDFSSWIRARFIQEIFKQHLEEKVLAIINEY